MQVRSISYVHDPEAFQLWFEAYVDLVKQAVLNRVTNKEDSGHTFDTGGENHENCRILSQFNESPGAFCGDATNDGVQNGETKIAGY